MNNIIKPSQCPYRSSVGGKYYCEHSSKTMRYCSWTDNAPFGCPITLKDLRKIKINKIIEKIK